MTQQKPLQEEPSNVDSHVNGRVDITMEHQKLQEQEQHDPELEQTACEEALPLCESSSIAIEMTSKEQHAADQTSQDNGQAEVDTTPDDSKKGQDQTLADIGAEASQIPVKKVQFTDTVTSDRSLETSEVHSEQLGTSETELGATQQHEAAEARLESFETAVEATAESSKRTGDQEVRSVPSAGHRENPEKHNVNTDWHDEAMTNLQAHAQAQQAKANLMITSLRARLRKRDIELRTVKEGHEQQLSAVVAHLLRLEGEMQKEQKQVIEALADRDDIIRRQKAAIDDLTEKNDRLMKTLKESQQYHAGKGVPQQNGDISIRDHGNKVVIRGTKGRSSGRSVKSNSGEFKTGNGEKPKVRFTTAMMERLRRHKSSLELYRPEPLEPLIEGSLRYFSSQDNLVDDEGGEGGEEAEQTNTPKSSDRGAVPVRREGNLQKKQRCRSLVDYPFVGELEEENEEVGGSSESCYEDGFSSSPARISRHDSGLSSSMSSLTGSGETPSWVRRWSGGGGGVNGGIRPRGKSADLSSSSSYSPQSPSSPSSFSPSPKTPPSSSSSPSSAYGFSELSKSRSVPHALPTVSEHDAIVGGGGGCSPGGTAGKERPHSLTSVELLTRDLSRSNSANNTSTPNLTPAGSASSLAVSSSPPSSSSSDSNPFKSFKNVFKRRGSKKKRSVALSQPGNQEHSETVKNYFKKHDLT
ncbi:hypothetical protein ElyMa_003960800 [Elysia marginata]|uniref:Lebercilin domain-containing protein n=1 Tax=Elysia marginata TaxID=1093978 RepID=A0AAV4FV88_9GAST|nr:hypothetical protein ElyMa_003960800 [Elysia marginata]